MRALLLCLLLSAPAGADEAGIDVSTHQGPIAWTAVRAAGARFAFVRIGDGATIADDRFEANWAGARAAGLLRGAYLFFRPEEEAEAQARAIAAAVGRLGPGDLPVALDVERLDDIDPAIVRKRLEDTLERVRAATGRAPLLYTNAATWAALGQPDPGDHELWIAHWGAEAPAVPPAWPGWRFWQLSSTGRIEGIAGAVDLDRFQGTLAELETLAGIARRPAPPDGLEAVVGDSVTLTWGAVEGATGYEVALRWRRGRRWTDYHRYSAPASALVVRPEVELGTFSWSVTACNHLGCSAASKPRTFDYKR
jgi:lysozyme